MIVACSICGEPTTRAGICSSCANPGGHVAGDSEITVSENGYWYHMSELKPGDMAGTALTANSFEEGAKAMERMMSQPVQVFLCPECGESHPVPYCLNGCNLNPIDDVFPVSRDWLRDHGSAIGEGEL